ncbi:GNAT family N-acetyltransferase [Lignipirellula cremea]|uniref:BioF2-like acetyltransferase domain-containing protein n=1 Tax=Lignipirellula cremea TaxID=2528010 RepID=A0A518DMI9_9BACT|nr:GNAT family N-acetyltransferase [Lignipirellula cremea]QDU93055.1 hypothetical protein Pla8534_08300 [Lignipirellula cremea]
MCEIRTIEPRQLTPELIAAWSTIQQSLPAFGSPYFRPEFTQQVARVRSDVRIAVLEQQGQPVGFFPYQYSGMGVLVPVGGKFSDYHGVIAPPEVEWTASQLLAACGASAWRFDHLVAEQQPFARYHGNVAGSPYLYLADGYEAYEQERKSSGSKELTKLARKKRKLDREEGPLRFEYDTRDPQVFETLLAWKRDQYERTGLTDVFQFPWTTELLQNIWDCREPDFSGLMSALYLGDRLIAMHFGMRSGPIMHSWFPAYDREFYKASPGLILLTEIAKVASDQGVTIFDLGKGDAEYKTNLKSGDFMVAEGEIELRPMARLLRNGYRASRDWIKASPLRGPAQIPWRMIRPLRDWMAFR